MSHRSVARLQAAVRRSQAAAAGSAMGSSRVLFGREQARRTPPVIGAAAAAASAHSHAIAHGGSALLDLQQRGLSSSSAPEIERRDHIIIGGGPVGSAAAMFLTEQQAEKEEDDPERESVLLLHDPKDRGAHEDWSRLARLSFDGPEEEFELSQHAIALLDLVDEVRANMSGAPCIPLKPGMLFVCSPGTNMHKTLTYGMENYGDEDFVQRSPDELEDLFPGNEFNLPKDTLCWTHPTGYCISPIELTDTMLGVARAYGTEIVGDRVAHLSQGADGYVRVHCKSGQLYETKKVFVFAGGQGKELLSASPDLPAIPELEQTYITGISTVRYKHRNHPANPAPGSGHVVTPITLGQLDVPDLCPFQANFSVVAEEWGDVYKTRLSGAAGSEVVETVADLHKVGEGIATQDAELAEIYGKVFGTLFPFLETEKALDFNRCVTYRNHYPIFSGTSLLKAQPTPESSLVITPGCFGVGVKFGPALGQAAAQHTYGEELETGMNVFDSGTLTFDEGAELVERAW